MNTFWFSVSNKNTSVLGKILQNARFAVENKTDLIQTTPFLLLLLRLKLGIVIFVQNTLFRDMKERQ